MKDYKILNWVFSIIFGLLFLVFAISIFVVIPLNLNIPIQYELSLLNSGAAAALFGLSVIIVAIAHKVIEHFSNNFGDISDLAFGSTRTSVGKPQSPLLKSFLPIAFILIFLTPVVLRIMSYFIKDNELAYKIQLYTGLFCVMALILFVIISTLRNAKK